MTGKNGQNSRGMRMNEQNHRLMLTDQDVPDGRLAIEAGLSEYNQEKAGYVNARELSVFVIDTNTDQIVGGLVGRTSLGLFFVDLIFLPEMLRRSGLGSEIMERAEAEASRRGMLDCGALHNHLPGTGFLRTPWLSSPRADGVQATGPYAPVYDETL